MSLVDNRFLCLSGGGGRMLYRSNGVDSKITVPAFSMVGDFTISIDLIFAEGSSGIFISSSESTPRSAVSWGSDGVLQIKINNSWDQLGNVTRTAETKYTLLLVRAGSLLTASINGTPTGTIGNVSATPFDVENFLSYGALTYAAVTMSDISLQTTVAPELDRFYAIGDGWGANPVIVDSLSGNDGTALNFVEPGWYLESAGLPVFNVHLAMDTATNHIFVRVPANDTEGTSKYIRYPLRRVIDLTEVNPATDRNLDAWCMLEGYEDVYNGSSFSTNRRIVNNGAWECAIEEVGAADFIGSHDHGDEILTSYTIECDGVIVPYITSSRVCANVKITQNSTLYRYGTGKSEPVADKITTWEWNNDSELILTNNIEWVAAFEVDRAAYLTMLPMARFTSEFITDTSRRSPLYLDEDLSGLGATDVYTDSFRAEIFGPTGVTATIEQIGDWDANSHYHVWNEAGNSYNKLYFSQVENGHVITIGDIWNQAAKYLITVDE